MATFLKRFNPIHAPIWLKLMLTMLTVLIVPLIIMLLVLQVQIQRYGDSSLRDYIEGEGIERTESIEERLEDSTRALQELTIGNYGSTLRSLLSSNNPLTAPIPISSLRYMNDDLVGQGLYNYVAVLTRGGLVVMSSVSDINDLQPFRSGANFTQVSGLQVTEIIASSQSLFIRTNDEGEINIFIREILTSGDNNIGYIVGQLNVENTFVEELLDSVPYREAYSYLITLNGDLIAPEGMREQALASIETSPVQSAIGGQSGLSNYSVNGTRVTGHYTRVEGTPFAIITEAPRFLRDFSVIGILQRAAFGIGVITIFGAIFVYAINRTITAPLSAIVGHFYALREGDFGGRVVQAERGDELGALARAFVSTRDEISRQRDELLNRLHARGRDLQATQQVVSVVATQRKLQVLLDEVVDLIVAKFDNIYHAQIFLLNINQTDAVLRSSTGDPGQQLLSRGHRLPIGSQSVIGQVTSRGETIVARDIGESAVHRPNQFLPDTRSELAIPLFFGDTIIGALDVQSYQSNTFTDDQITVLQIMAGQIAIAIENARLYEESIQQVEALNMNTRRVTAQAWGEYMQSRRKQTLISVAGQDTDTEFETLIEQAEVTNAPAIGEETPQQTIPVAIPIALREEVLGVVELELNASTFNHDKVLLAQELVNRLAVSLDNARLFQESQRAIDRERLVNDIASQLSQQTDIERILQTAVREVGQALRSPQVRIQLQTADSDDTQNGNGSHPHTNS